METGRITISMCWLFSAAAVTRITRADRLHFAPRFMKARIASFDVALARSLQDPHELGSWVNQIDGYNAHFLLLQDPRELASWVNQIES